jgi:hypothetical protein
MKTPTQPATMPLEPSFVPSGLSSHQIVDKIQSKKCKRLSLTWNSTQDQRRMLVGVASITALGVVVETILTMGLAKYLFSVRHALDSTLQHQMESPE